MHALDTNDWGSEKNAHAPLALTVNDASKPAQASGFTCTRVTLTSPNAPLNDGAAITPTYSVFVTSDIAFTWPISNAESGSGTVTNRGLGVPQLQKTGGSYVPPSCPLRYTVTVVYSEQETPGVRVRDILRGSSVIGVVSKKYRFSRFSLYQLVVDEYEQGFALAVDTCTGSETVVTALEISHPVG